MNPTKRSISGRTETYPPDEKKRFVTAIQVAAAWRAVSFIPAQYAVATAYHETSLVSNEVDFEAPDKDGNRFESSGIFQVDADEIAFAVRSGRLAPGADVLELAGCTVVLACAAEFRLVAIAAAAQLAPPPQTCALPTDKDWRAWATQLPADVWAYLAIAHNEGIGEDRVGGKGALGSIAEFGLDWNGKTGWKARNPDLREMARYGDDAISGGVRWLGVVNSDLASW